MGELIVFAVTAPPVRTIVAVGAGLVVAVIIVVAIVFFTRNSRKNKAAAVEPGPTGTEPWQRQSQAGIPGQAGWGTPGQQPGQMNAQEQWNAQQPGGWGAQPQQANSWNQPADKTAQAAQPGAWNAQANNPASQPNAWGAQGQQANSWNQQPEQAAQPGGWNAQANNPASQPNAWGAQGQQANSWNQQPEQSAQPGAWNAQANNPASQPNAWGAQGQQANSWNQQPEQAAQPGGGWNAQQPQANQWGTPPASPASPSNQQDGWNQPQPQGGAQGWGNPSPSPAQPSFGGAQGWNDQNAAQQPIGQNAWSPAAQPMTPSGNLSNPNAQNAQGWQQPGGFGAAGFGAPPASQDNATVYGGGPDVDKTVLRGPQGQAQGIGLVRVEEGKEVGRIYEVRKPSLSIGRSRESDIFLEDLAVSRLHASIVDLGNNAYAVKDEGSANGTKVNGQQLSKYQTYTLQEGDRVQLGQTVLVFARR